MSFSGSCVTFAKLQELMTTRPVVFPGGPVAFGGSIAVAVALAIGVVVDADSGVVNAWLLVLLGLVALGVGVLFVLPVGGADVPIVISLLNAFTGLTVAASGYVLDNTLLLVAGTLVGASGTILTRMMASAMGRSTASILFGAFKGGSTAGSTEVSDRPVRSASPEDVAILLAYARKVVIVPGYGLAVAQAQHTIHELVDVLEGKGVQVVYGIHPVAGRMPGHMNVLLAEANVPYEQLKEMDEANSELSSTDVALVVGANDVVNPAAKTSPGSPIYGMPILDGGRREGGRLPQAVDAARLRRDRERAAVRRQDDPALRRREGLAHQGGAVAQGALAGWRRDAACCEDAHGGVTRGPGRSLGRVSAPRQRRPAMPEQHDPKHAAERHRVREAREHVHRSLDDAAQPEDDRASQQRNAGVAIAVLAIVVVLLLLAIVSGSTGAFRP